MGHFDLQLEPGTLRKVQTSLEEIADHLKSRGGVVRGTPGEIGDDWTGEAADSVKPEMTNLGTLMSGAGGFSHELDAAAAAVKSLASTYENANDEIGRLNTRWDNAQDLDEEDREARRRSLTAEFDTLTDELQSATMTCGQALAASSPVSVTLVAGRAAVPRFDYAGLRTKLSLGGQARAWSDYQERRQKVEDGDLPPFSQMSESEREAYLEAHPNMLDALMAQDDPDAQMREDVVALAVPRVNGEDGRADARTVLAAVDGKAKPEEFLAGFRDAGEVSDAMALLGPWAEKHGVDLSDNEIVANAQAYQQEFLAGTGDRWQDVLGYIGDDRHSWEIEPYTIDPAGPRSSDIIDSESVGGFTPSVQDRMRQIYGDTILSVSNEEFGGGWDQLPGGIRETITNDEWGRPGGDIDRMVGLLNDTSEGIPPGDTLTVHLAHNVQESLYMTKGDVDPSPGGTDIRLHGVGGEEAWGGLLEVISRNHDATAVVLGADPASVGSGDENPNNDFTGQVPEDFDSKEFVKNIYSYHWDDDGAAAASLTDWMDHAMDQGEGSPDFDLAHQAYDGLTGTLTSTGEDGIYQDLMDTQAESAMSAGAANPELVRSLGRVTEHEQILTEIATEGSEPETSADLRLMMLIAGDEQAGERLSGAVMAHNADIMGSDMNSRNKSEQIGNLRGLLDAALFNEAYERTGDAQAAEDERAKRIRTGIGMVTSIIPDGGTGASGASGYLLSHFVEADNVEPVEPRIAPEWSEEGNHVTLFAYDALATQLHADGEISDAEYQRVVNFDADTTGGHVGEYQELLEKHGVEPPDRIGHEYTSRLNNWTASGDGSELQDLIEHGTPPGSG